MLAPRWFRQALALTGARLATVSVAVAAEASAVPTVYGSGDPGDCFIIATARVRRLPVVTRDGRMLALAASAPDYLEAVECRSRPKLAVRAASRCTRKQTSLGAILGLRMRHHAPPPASSAANSAWPRLSRTEHRR